MADVKQFALPDVGEGLTEAEIVSWKVKPGDTVAVNDVLVEIETAKSLVELPSPFAGVVAALYAEEGATVAVGTPIIGIGVAGAAGEPAPAGPAESAPAESGPAESGPAESRPEGGDQPRTAVLVGYGPRTGAVQRRPRKSMAREAEAGVAPSAHAAFASPAERVAHAEGTLPVQPHAPAAEAGAVAQGSPGPRPAASPDATGDGVSVLAKPPVRKLAKDLGVDLRTVPGTGPGGTVTRADVESAAAGSGAGGAPLAAAGAAYPFDPRTREYRYPIKGVRKATARAMVASAFTAPHVTEFVTVDVTRTVDLVERLRTTREMADLRVGPLLLVMKALLLAVRRHPDVNASWDEAAQEIVVKDYVNLGIAVATARGLIVPTIKDADRMTLPQLATALRDLTETARAGRTQPAGLSGGTITITNVGVFGIDTGTPIINPGEAAILAVGAIRDMPWVHEGVIAVRKVTTLGLSFDHRLVDGALGSQFLGDIAGVLEHPDLALAWG